VTRRPDLARACHQLERHGSGTPNDVAPEQPTWNEYLASFKAATSITMAEACRNIAAWQESWRSGREAA
jgi:hypothetical protein